MKPFHISKVFDFLFGIRANEFLAVQSFFIYLTIISIFYTISFIVASTLFLKSLHIHSLTLMLPWVYIGSAFCTLLVTWLHTFLIEKWVIKKIIISTQIVVAVSLIIFRQFATESSTLLDYFLLIGVEMSGYFFTMLFFSYMGGFYSFHDAQRLYTYIAGGLALGSLVGGQLAVILIHYIPVINILYVSALLSLIIAVFPFIVSKIKIPRYQYNPKEYRYHVPIFKEIRENKYLMLIFLIVLISAIGFVTVDYQMLIVASKKFAEKELALFLGNFFSYVGFLQLFVQFILLNWLLKQFGLLKSMLLFPILLAITSILFLILPILFFATLANALRLGLSETLQITALQLLCLPLIPRLQNYAQSIIGNTLPVVGQALGSIILLISAYYQLKINHYMIYSVIATLIWVYLLFHLMPEYKKTLINNFRHLTFQVNSFRKILIPADAAPSIQKVLKYSTDQQIMFILSSVSKKTLKKFRSYINELTLSNNNQLVSYALKLLGKLGNRSDQIFIQQHLHDAREEVQCTAISAYMKLLRTEGIPAVKSFLTSANNTIRKTSLIACLRYGDFLGKDLVISQVNNLLKEQPILALQVISETDNKIFINKVNDFLLDSDESIRIAAIQASKKIIDPYLILNLLTNLSNSHLRSYVIDALSSKQNDPKNVIEFFSSVSERDKESILLILGNIGKKTALEFILNVILSSTSPLLLNAAFHALYILFVSDNLGRINNIKFKLCQERLLQTISILQQAIKESAALSPITKQLFVDNIHSYMQKLFILLGVQYGIRELSNISVSLLSHKEDIYQYCIELMKVWIPKKEFKKLLPVLNQVDMKLPMEFDTFAHTTIKKLLESDLWIRCLTIFAAHEVKLDNQQIRAYIMSTEEKRFYDLIVVISFLKQVEMFNLIPANFLLKIAEITETKTFFAGETLFKQGDLGNALYLINTGCISVSLDEGTEIAQLGPGECLGELAIIDGLVRSASAKAIEDTTVLQIYSEDFNDLLMIYPEISRNLLIILSRRLRETLIKY